MTISVIIPSKNRLRQMRQCLRSLTTQTLKPNEIIVVENGERPTYQTLVSEFPQLPLVLKLEPELGKAAARNLGLSVAKSEIVAFLDDDCQPRPNWIAQIKLILSQNPSAEVVLGDYQDRPVSLLNDAYNLQYKRWFFDLRVNKKTGQVRCGGALNTRNCAVRRRFLTTHNLSFDRRYDRFGYAEDTDFGEQLERAGAKIIFGPRLVVVHRESTSLVALLKKKFANGRAMSLLRQKGIYHAFKKKRKNFFHKLQRALTVTKKYRFAQKLVFLSALYIIVLFYHLGVHFQSVQARLNPAGLPAAPPK